MTKKKPVTPIWKENLTSGMRYLFVLCDRNGITTRLNTISYQPIPKEREKALRAADNLLNGWTHRWDGLLGGRMYIEESSQ